MYEILFMVSFNFFFQIFVQFEPQDIGYFSQFWEVRKTNDVSCDQTIDRVQLLGEVCAFKILNHFGVY